MELELLTNFDLIKASSDVEIHDFTFIISPQSTWTGNPYALRKLVLESISTDRKDEISPLQKTRAGKIIFRTSNKEIALEVLNIKEIGGMPVQVRLSQDNLLGTYVIRNIDTDLELKDILEELEAQSIIIHSIKRFVKTVEKNNIPLRTILIKTPTPHSHLPLKVHIAMEMRYLDQYKEQPRECQRCFRSGHGRKPVGL